MHELYLRMSTGRGLAFGHPAQFSSYAGRATRHLLADRARDRMRRRARGDWVRVALTGGHQLLAITGHRQVDGRTFPEGALDGLDAVAKAKVNRTNAGFGVHWRMSYANADETRTFCICEGPNEGAIREAAVANEIPVDRITGVPVTHAPD
mgnify:FL=1